MMLSQQGHKAKPGSTVLTYTGPGCVAVCPALFTRDLTYRDGCLCAVSSYSTFKLQ